MDSPEQSEDPPKQEVEFNEIFPLFDPRTNKPFPAEVSATYPGGGEEYLFMREQGVINTRKLNLGDGNLVPVDFLTQLIYNYGSIKDGQHIESLMKGEVITPLSPTDGAEIQAEVDPETLQLILNTQSEHNKTPYEYSKNPFYLDVTSSEYSRLNFLLNRKAKPVPELLMRTRLQILTPGGIFQQVDTPQSGNTFFRPLEIGPHFEAMDFAMKYRKGYIVGLPKNLEELSQLRGRFVLLTKEDDSNDEPNSQNTT